MRPFRLPVAERWVDLDSVQVIHEPVYEDRLSGTPYVILRWEHAFREDLASFRLEQKTVWDTPTGKLRPEDNFRDTLIVPEKDLNGELTSMVRMREEVFKPFLEAWRARPSSSKGRTPVWQCACGSYQESFQVLKIEDSRGGLHTRYHCTGLQA